MAGTFKPILAPRHSRGIAGYPRRTVPHDHITSVADNVKKMDLRELRTARETGYDNLYNERGFIKAEIGKRNAAGAAGSGAQFALDDGYSNRAAGPDDGIGRGLTPINRSTREIVDGPGPPGAVKRPQRFPQ